MVQASDSVGRQTADYVKEPGCGTGENPLQGR